MATEAVGTRTERAPYEEFIAHTNWPVVSGAGVESLADLELGEARPDGVRGAVVQLEGMQGLSGLVVLELPIGSSSGTVRHLYEEWILVLSGSGTVEFEASGGAGLAAGQTVTFPWRQSSVFAVPLNMRHRLRNTGDVPARLACITNAPLFMDLLGSADAVFQTNLTFPERERALFVLPRAGEMGMADPGGFGNHPVLRCAVLEDVRALDLPDAVDIRGEGFGFVSLEMGDGIFGAHVSEVRERYMSNAHWHMGGAILICVEGNGYSLAWPAEAGTRPFESGNSEEVRRQDYVPTGVVAVGIGWYHQHLNTGRGSMRQVAFRYGVGEMCIRDRLKIT